MIRSFWEGVAHTIYITISKIDIDIKYTNMNVRIQTKVNEYHHLKFHLFHILTVLCVHNTYLKVGTHIQNQSSNHKRPSLKVPNQTRIAPNLEQNRGIPSCVGFDIPSLLGQSTSRSVLGGSGPMTWIRG